MTRFDYNIALSLGLLLYLEVHQNDYFEFFKPVDPHLFSGRPTMSVLQLYRPHLDIHGVRLLALHLSTGRLRKVHPLSAVGSEMDHLCLLNCFSDFEGTLVLSS